MRDKTPLLASVLQSRRVPGRATSELDGPPVWYKGMLSPRFGSFLLPVEIRSDGCFRVVEYGFAHAAVELPFGIALVLGSASAYFIVPPAPSLAEVVRDLVDLNSLIAPWFWLGVLIMCAGMFRASKRREVLLDADGDVIGYKLRRCVGRIALGRTSRLQALVSGETVLDGRWLELRGKHGMVERCFGIFLCAGPCVVQLAKSRSRHVHDGRIDDLLAKWPKLPLVTGPTVSARAWSWSVQCGERGRLD